jgi:hypothetical protein
LTRETRLEGPEAPPNPRAAARSTNNATATTTPKNHPSKKPKLVARAEGASSMRITAIMGTGLMAMPRARGGISPTTAPMSAPRASSVLPADRRPGLLVSSDGRTEPPDRSSPALGEDSDRCEKPIWSCCSSP